MVFVAWVIAGYFASAFVVLAGLGMRFALGSRINDALNWIMLALGMGVLIPNVLRWYPTYLVIAARLTTVGPFAFVLNVGWG